MVADDEGSPRPSPKHAWIIVLELSVFWYCPEYGVMCQYYIHGVVAQGRINPRRSMFDA
jgi:hypothetical protein